MTYRDVSHCYTKHQLWDMIGSLNKGVSRVSIILSLPHLPFASPPPLFYTYNFCKLDSYICDRVDLIDLPPAKWMQGEKLLL